MEIVKELNVARRMVQDEKNDYNSLPYGRKFFKRALVAGGAAGCYLFRRKFFGDEFISGSYIPLDTIFLWICMYSAYSFGNGIVKSVHKVASGARLHQAERSLDDLTREYAKSQRTDNLLYVSRLERKAR